MGCMVCLMDSPTIQVNIVDSHGTRQTFKVERVGLDCGPGLIEIWPCEPAFCRGFERGVLTLDQGAHCHQHDYYRRHGFADRARRACSL